jgi:hypothetical protein
VAVLTSGVLQRAGVKWKQLRSTEGKREIKYEKNIRGELRKTVKKLLVLKWAID